MSQEVEDLLAKEGMDDVDELLRWAREKAANLVSSAQGDQELGPLLEAGGTAGDAPPPRAPEPVPPPEVEQSMGPEVQQPPMVVSESGAVPVTTPAARTDEIDLDEIEELDAEELELMEVEEAPEHTPPPGPPPAAPAVEKPTFGPPDGNEVVPDWKAALLSTQTESDAEAAERVKEASTVSPLPTEPVSMPISARLEAEEDEISQHSVDLSDLD